MNSIKFKILGNGKDTIEYTFSGEEKEEIFTGSFEIYTIIDEENILKKERRIGLLAEKFFEQDFLSEKIRLGICGCEGCDDYDVEITLQNNTVIWKDFHADTEYSFGISEYRNALQEVKLSWIRKKEKLYRKREKRVEDWTEFWLKDTKAEGIYIFEHVQANAENKNIKVIKNSH